VTEDGPRLEKAERTFRSQVGRRLRTQRVWLALTQDDLAGKAGVSRNYVSATERGAIGLDAWRLRLLARALGTTLGWLLDDSDSWARS
jgi:transcriptional regulator with XRE-family HTH domain